MASERKRGTSLERFTNWRNSETILQYILKASFIKGLSQLSTCSIHENTLRYSKKNEILFYLLHSILIRGRRVIAISGSLIWSKTLMELIFNPCGEFRWSSEGSVSQIYSPHLHVGALGIFSDLLRSVQMLKRDWVQKATGSYRTYYIPIKTAALVPEFAVEDLTSAELLPRFPRLQWRTYPWAVHSDDDNLHNVVYHIKQRNKTSYLRSSLLPILLPKI